MDANAPKGGAGSSAGVVDVVVVIDWVCVVVVVVVAAASVSVTPAFGDAACGAEGPIGRAVLRLCGACM